MECAQPRRATKILKDKWHCHGVTYRKMQDPRSEPGKPADLYAPDCVQGPDGRYYLYYVAMGPNVKNFGPIGVAVFNDPAMLNDNGRIWLYYGWGLGRDFRSKLFAPVLNAVQSRLLYRPVSEIRTAKPCILSCAVAELEQALYFKVLSGKIDLLSFTLE